jgi:hypothetical protein
VDLTKIKDWSNTAIKVTGDNAGLIFAKTGGASTLSLSFCKKNQRYFLYFFLRPERNRKSDVSFREPWCTRVNQPSHNFQMRVIAWQE